MIRIMFCLISLLASTTALAGNFSITPLAPVPTAIRPGDTVPIYFSVKNMTKSTRSGYVLSQLPANVQQSSSSSRYPNSVCPSPLSLPAGGECTLVFNIKGPVSFNFSLCNGPSCTNSSASVALATQATDSTFPYGTAPSGNVCTSSDEYATPETMLGSWAMLDAVEMDLASGQLPSVFSDNVVYAVGTAAVGNYYGYSGCSGGCNQLNGYCFAMKFTTKTTGPKYMIFQSVNIAANDNSFDVYLAGGGSGNYPDSCKAFWGTGNSSVDWNKHMDDEDTTCASYFNNFTSINSQYSVTYNGTPHPAKTTLSDACTFATTSGFNSENFTGITFVPVTCPTALTQVTGLALASTITTIGTTGVKLIPIATLTESSFSSGSQITGATTTQMQDCKTPSSGYCGNVTSTITNYQSSISASLTAPLTEPAPNPYCPLNPNQAGFCSTDGCATAMNPSSVDYCNVNETQCLQCGGGPQWCDCPG